MSITPDLLSKERWYALRVRTGCESIAATALRSHQLRIFVPTALVERRYSDRVKRVETPLFPGYIFCRFALKSLLLVVQSAAVLDVVRVGKQPTPIAQEDIDTLRRLQLSGLSRKSVRLTAGQPVVVKDGAMDGVRGAVVRESGRDRLLIAVPLLQRSVLVEIESWRLTPLKPVGRSTDRHLARSTGNAEGRG